MSLIHVQHPAEALATTVSHPEYCLHDNYSRPQRRRNLRPPASRGDPISPIGGRSSGAFAPDGYSASTAACGLLRDVILDPAAGAETGAYAVRMRGSEVRR